MGCCYAERAWIEHCHTPISISLHLEEVTSVIIIHGMHLLYGSALYYYMYMIIAVVVAAVLI